MGTDDTIASTFTTTLISTDLKKSDSLVHPIVGEIVIREELQADGKTIIFYFNNVFIYTVTVDWGEKNGWECLKAVGKYESHAEVPEPNHADPNGAIGTESDATARFQQVMKTQLKR